jgi:ATP-binding cassette, subfamily B (MDR/TAP), member 1
MGLIPLILLSQIIQLSFIQGFSQSKGRFYGEASQIFNESVMNIRTIISLDAMASSYARYERKLSDVFMIILKKSLVSGFMFGVSNMLMFTTFGLTFFLSIVFVSNYNISVVNSLTAVFLILFACLSAGNKANNIQNLSHLGEALNWIFRHVDLED